MATDARVRYTKMVIRDAFLSLLREKSVKQITVTELCALAEINRATFDLLEQIELEMLQHLQKTAGQLHGKSAREHFIAALQNMRKYHLYAVIGSELGDPNFSQRVSACLYETAGTIVFQKLPELPDAEKQMVYCFLEQGGRGILEHWMENGMVEEPGTVAQMIFQLSAAVIQRKPI